MDFNLLRSKADRKFGSDIRRHGMVSRAIDFAEEWSNETQFSMSDYPTEFSRMQKRRECETYIKERLYQAREEEFGFIGGLLSAILFSLLVQIVVKWIMDRWFN